MTMRAAILGAVVRAVVRAVAVMAAAVVVRAVVRVALPAERGDHSNGQFRRRRVQHIAGGSSNIAQSGQRRRDRVHRGERGALQRKFACYMWEGYSGHTGRQNFTHLTSPLRTVPQTR